MQAFPTDADAEDTAPAAGGRYLWKNFDPWRCPSIVPPTSDITNCGTIGATSTAAKSFSAAPDNIIQKTSTTRVTESLFLVAELPGILSGLGGAMMLLVAQASGDVRNATLMTPSRSDQ